MTFGDLRQQLVAPGGERPELALLLPAGWVLHRADADSLRREARAAADALPSRARATLAPDLLRLAASIETPSGTDLVGVIRQESVPAEAFVPMSLVVAWLHPPSGATSVELGERLIRARGATPMPSAPGVLRWLEHAPIEDAESSGVLGGPCYLIPAPGTSDALLVRTAFATPSDADDEVLRWRDAVHVLADSIVATLRWRRDAARR